MDEVSLSVTGPFGSELVPSDVPIKAVPDVVFYFSSVMSGEVELAELIEKCSLFSLSPAFKGAIAMLVERARRNPDHAPPPEVIDRSSASSFVGSLLVYSPGRNLPAAEAYAAYERWAAAGGLMCEPCRSIGETRFHRLMALHYERRAGSDGAFYRDVALRPPLADRPASPAEPA